MKTGVWRAFALLILSGAIAVVGCANRPKLAEVKGKVTLKGKPLPSIMVEFIPEGPVGPRSTGVTDENGQYTMICEDKRAGAVIGPNRVILRDTTMFGDKFLGRKMEQLGPKDVKPSRIPEHFGDIARTPLKKEVKPEPNTIDLELSTP